MGTRKHSVDNTYGTINEVLVTDSPRSELEPAKTKLEYNNVSETLVKASKVIQNYASGEHEIHLVDVSNASVGSKGDLTNRKNVQLMMFSDMQTNRVIGVTGYNKKPKYPVGPVLNSSTLKHKKSFSQIAPM